MSPRDYEKIQKMMDDQRAAILASMPASGGIKRVQRGVGSLTGTAISVAINEVAPEKTFVIVEAFGHSGTPATASAGDQACGGYLLDSKTVRLYVESTSVKLLAWQVIEFN